MGLFAGLGLIIMVASRLNNMLVTALMVVATIAFEVFYGWEYDGKTLARRIGERRDLPKRALSGESDYITGAMSHLAGHEGGHPMPGILASTQLIRGIDGFGQPFDAIHYPPEVW